MTQSTLDLFDVKARAPDKPFFNVYEAVAKRKLNAPAEWEWYALDGRTYQATGDTIVEGGVRARDARNRKTWKGVVGQKCVVTQAEVEAMRAEFEQTTGKCVECAGCGETLAGSSVETGPRYRTCRKCGGSGRASLPDNA